MLESKSAGTDSKQDRSAQPGRGKGGNCSEATGAASGGHGSKRGERIAIGGGTGKSGSPAKGQPGAGFQCGGNAACGASREKHGQKTQEFVTHENGKGGAKRTLISTNIQVDDRGKDTSGNASNGGREKTGSKKATRLDMSVARFAR